MASKHNSTIVFPTRQQTPKFDPQFDIPTITVMVNNRTVEISWITSQCIAVCIDGHVTQVRGDAALATFLAKLNPAEELRLLPAIAAVAAPRTHENILKAPVVDSESAIRAAESAKRDRGHLYHRISVVEAIADYENRYGRKAAQVRVSKYDDFQPIDGIVIERTGAVLPGSVWVGSN